jgi:hypothetical protein
MGTGIAAFFAPESSWGHGHIGEVALMATAGGFCAGALFLLAFGHLGRWAGLGIVVVPLAASRILRPTLGAVGTTALFVIVGVAGLATHLLLTRRSLPTAA